MIRRQPTLIALSDIDVQDAKSVLDKLKKSAEESVPAGADVGRNNIAGPSKKELSKEERLGLR